MLTITPETYNKWRTTNGFSTPETIPANILRQAHLLVSDHLSRCTPITSNTEATIIDAVCTQAAYWVQADIVPFAESIQTGGKLIASASLNGGTISYADTAATKAVSREKAAETLCAEAAIILRLAGARPQQPHVIG